MSKVRCLCLPHLMIRDATIFVIVDEKSADFRIAVVKCLLMRNKKDDLFHINGSSSYNPADALGDKAVLAHFHLDSSQSWTISSIRAFLQQHHPEILTPSSDVRAADALSSSGIAMNPATAAAGKKQEETVDSSSLKTSPVVLPDQNAAASKIDDDKMKLSSSTTTAKHEAKIASSDSLVAQESLVNSKKDHLAKVEAAAISISATSMDKVNQTRDGCYCKP
jgi:hypothetical protein